jgi:hypothetical protein
MTVCLAPAADCLSLGGQPVRMGEMPIRRRDARDTLAANR